MLCAVILLFSSGFYVKVNAVDIDSFVTVSDELNNEKAAGLIISFSLSLATDRNLVKITADTIASETMAKIGFTDITIQRRYSGSSSWDDAYTISDQIVTNSVYHVLNNLPVSVDGGFYYRIKLTHYAKETGWFFPSSQSITNYSNESWVMF
jgi:hypothetical protein